MAQPFQIIIYTDGSSKGNPGPGGYGVVMLALQNGRLVKRQELAEGFFKTTNNRMELLAVIVALEALKGEGVEATLYSDSQYVINAITKGWALNWQKTNFKDKKNPDLWKRFLQVNPRHKVRYMWVKGHAGNPENERCDRLATSAADAPTTRDVAFESGIND